MTRFLFDDNTVSGQSNHAGFTLALGYKSLVEIGYTDAGTILWNASVEEDGGYTPEDGFYTRTKLFYLRAHQQKLFYLWLSRALQGRDRRYNHDDLPFLLR